MTQKIGFPALTQDVIDAINAGGGGGIPQPFLNMRDYEDQVVGGNWTPAFNAALADAASVTARTRTIYFPRGVYSFTTQPNNIEIGVRILGDGLQATSLIRAFSPSANSGLFNLRIQANGVEICGMAIRGGSGTSGGHLITAMSDASNVIGFIRFDNLYLSTETNNTHQSALYINGTARTAAPIGVRDIVISRCSIFGGTVGAVELYGVVACHFIGTDTFDAGGTTGRLVVGGSASVPSNYVSGDFSNLAGLAIENCIFVNLRAGVIAGNITNASSAQRVAVNGYCAGSVQSNWTNSKYTNPTV